MIGVGISAGLTGAKRARSIQDPLPALDLDWATDRSLPAAYGPTPSFSRASTGTYFTSSGLLTSAAINGPRFNHVYNGSSWVSKGLLVEEQRTNNLLQSEDLTVTWTANRGSITSNTTVAPDGTTTADRFVESTANGVHGPVQTPVTTTAAAYTVSGFFRAGTRSVVVMRFQDYATGLNGVGAEFDLSAGTISAPAVVIGAFTSPSATISNVGGGWYRCTVTGTTNTTQCSLRIETCTTAGAFSAALFQGSSYTGDGSSYFDSWGYQLEAGSFATSYIPTHTSAVTRSADVCQITGTNFSGLWNEPGGTLVAEGDTPASGTKSLVSADNATANESSVLQTVGTDPLFVVTDGGVAQVSIDAGTVVYGTAFKLAAAYAINDFAVSKDAAAVVTDTSGTIPTPTQLNIGADAAGNYVCGHIARLRYYSTRLTNAKLQELST